MANWIGEVIVQMHYKKIKKKDLAAAMGVTPEYISMIFNGHKTPKNAEQKVKAALAELVAEKEAAEV